MPDRIDMKTRLITFLLFTLLFLPAAHATHDSGLGKSNDQNPEDPYNAIATAPEPRSLLLLGSGLVIARLVNRRTRSGNRPDTDSI